MRWPWTRDDRDLTHAQREQEEIVRRGKDREPKLKRLEQQKDDPFAARFRAALGGSR